MNLGTLLAFIIIGLIVGILVGGAWLLISIFIAEYKSKKEMKKGKIMKIKDGKQGE